MTLAPRIIALLTDFGDRDGFPGIMKGVILSIHPQARLVDLSHSVPPQDIEHGAFLLRSSLAYFPKRTIFLAVVDPGVGTDRRPLVVRSGGQYFVGPDNGLLTSALEADRRPSVWTANRPSWWRRPVSQTFHGRDVFAPLAAHLATGVPPGKMGSTCLDPIRLAVPDPVQDSHGVTGQIIHVDGFGNLITNITPRHVVGCPVRFAEVLGQEAPCKSAYGDVAAGSWVAVWGSSGYLEIALNHGSAAGTIPARRGTRVSIQLG